MKAMQMNSMEILDFVLLLVLCWLAITGLRKGLIYESLRMVSWVLFWFLLPLMAGPWLLPMSVTYHFVARILLHFVPVPKKGLLSSIDRLGGLVLGLGEWLMLVLLLAISAKYIPMLMDSLFIGGVYGLHLF